MNAIINIIKPSGVSSNRILYLIKQRFKGEKVGHFGTLDPLATGVLPIAVGKSTKLFNYFLNKDKEYIAIFEFGKTTDTLDSEGQITQVDNNIPSLEQIESVLKDFIGNIKQVPPLYSAININGVKAYNLARNGVNFDIKEKDVTIYNLKIIKQIDKSKFMFRIHCSSGTYIRSLIRDIAEKLNTIGYMAGLIRVRAGCFNIEQANTVEEILSNKFKEHKIEDVLQLPKIVLDEKYYQKLCNGVKIEYNHNLENDFLLYCKNELFGIARIIDNKINIITYLKE